MTLKELIEKINRIKELQDKGVIPSSYGDVYNSYDEERFELTRLLSTEIQEINNDLGADNE